MSKLKEIRQNFEVGNQTNLGTDKFKVNKYISLKLEEDQTNIYINNERFIHCKHLLLNIPTNDLKNYKEIDSIDEAARVLYKSQEEGKFKISPKVEFWGHCSNLQVWTENDYDTRILHSNLAFPLLKKLAEVGDPLAIKVFKKEIVKRFKTRFIPVTFYLIQNGYLNHLSKKELDYIKDGIRKSKNSFISSLRDLYNVIVYKEKIELIAASFIDYSILCNIIAYLKGLKEIANSNTQFARTLLKEAIVESFGIKSFQLHSYLLNKGYLDYLSKEEMYLLLNEFENLLENPNLTLFERNVLEKTNDKLKDKSKKFERS